MTASYCLSKLSRVTSHYLYYSVCSKIEMSASSTNTSATRQQHIQ